MEVIAIIMVAFAALLAVERKTEDLGKIEPDRPIMAYYVAKKAGRSPVVERGRFKIAGKHGDYIIREKTPVGTATHGSVYTLRQAKEWMWCLHNNWDYEECRKAHKRKKQREYTRAYRHNRHVDSVNRDLELMSRESGWGAGNYSTDEQGYRTYYPPEGPGFRTYY
tara:strand:- start:70 stop:567 length:498 start_codon:yes stop_codon:yes gene_type:complete